jgi:hypothetical protein
MTILHEKLTADKLVKFLPFKKNKMVFDLLLEVGKGYFEIKNLLL